MSVGAERGAGECEFSYIAPREGHLIPIAFRAFCQHACTAGAGSRRLKHAAQSTPCSLAPAPAPLAPAASANDNVDSTFETQSENCVEFDLTQFQVPEGERESAAGVSATIAVSRQPPLELRSECA